MPDVALRPWRPSDPWEGLAPAGRFGATAGPAGVRFEPLPHVALATIIVRDGKGEAFRTFASQRWGFAVPGPGRASFGEQGDLVWSAPEQWLAVAPQPGRLDDLADALNGIAGVTEQGDGRALVKIGGSCARRMLAKTLAIDLHPRVFEPGSAAVTAMAHVSVQVWLRDEAPTFVLAAPRTLAGTIWSALTASAAEYGYDVAGDGASR